MKRAAIYCRISLDRDGEQLGVERQEKDCRALAERLGWDVVVAYADNNRSAWKRNRSRPGWDQLMADITGRVVDAVVVYHGDRLIRQPRDLEDLLDVAEHGVQLASPSGQRDLSNPDDRFVLRIEVAQACKASDDTSRRAKRKHLELAENGAPVGGGRPFGYAADRKTVVEEERALVREAAERVLAGGTVRGVCQDWNRRGLTTTRGGRWNQTGLRRVLTCWRSAGVRALGDTPVAYDAWEPLLDAETHARLRAVLLAPGRTRGGYGPRTHALTGLLVCWRCGRKLIARPQSTRRRTYVCTSNPDTGGCGGIRVVADDLEAWVAELLFARVDGPEFAAAAASQPDDDPVPEIHRCEEKLLHLAEDWAADRMTRAEWLHARGEVEARLAAARRRLVRVPVAPGTGSGLREAWAELGVDQRHGLLRMFVDQVEIGAARRGVNRFDPSRVSVTWRV